MKYLIATATLNEVDTVVELIDGIKAVLPKADILFVDDSSTDGTLEALHKQDVIVIQRPGKLGIGSAHLLAMKYALKGNYDYLITLDADLSHSPKDIPKLIEKSNDYDFVIGSRFCDGGSCNYPPSRLLISRLANYLVRALLSVPLHETTTSFRIFNRSLLEKLLGHRIQRNGYSFFFATTFYAKKLGAKLTEVPIHFADRRAGSSKIRKSDILRAIVRLVILAFSNLKEATPRKTTSDTSCITCKSEYLSLLYPEKRTKEVQIDISCTGTVHGNHGPIKECLQCGLRQMNPLPEGIESLYEEVEDLTYVANISAREKTFTYNWKKIERLLPNNGRLLDVGCYCGVWANEASKLGYDVTGVDPSKWAIEYAKTHYNLRAFQGSACNVKEKFDIVTSWDVLEHVSSPNDFLQDIRTRLNDGGFFCFSTVMIDSLFARMLGSRWPWYVDMHLSYFNNQTLSRLLENAGFSVIQKSHYTHIVKVSYLANKLTKLGFTPAKIAKNSNGFIPVCMRDVCLWVCVAKPS